MRNFSQSSERLTAIKKILRKHLMRVSLFLFLLFFIIMEIENIQTVKVALILCSCFFSYGVSLILLSFVFYCFLKYPIFMQQDLLVELGFWLLSIMGEFKRTSRVNCSSGSKYRVSRIEWLFNINHSFTMQIKHIYQTF